MTEDENRAISEQEQLQNSIARADTSSADDTDDAADAGTEPADTGRTARTWVWMAGVSAFGLFLVFGSVSAHYWDENAAGTYYVPVQRGMQVLDVWRAQVSGLPDVSNQLALKVLFLGSVFAFLGLTVVALWLATVELWARPAGPDRPSGDDTAPDVGAPTGSVSVPSAPAG